MKILKIISGIILGIGLIILLFVKLHEKHEEKRKVESERAKTESAGKSMVSQLPDTLIVYYTLKKGDEPIRVEIKSGYKKYELYGGGKQYYCQPQNKKREIWGGGNCVTNDNPYATYADISYYNEEITITCKHIK